MDWEKLVREVATSMQLVDEEGRLRKLDSLTAIELISDIETRSGVDTSSVELSAETFASIESVARALSALG